MSSAVPSPTPSSGTVSGAASVPPLSALGRRAHPPAITALMRSALETPGLLSLAAGFTDNATLPVTAVGAALAGLGASPATSCFSNCSAAWACAPARCRWMPTDGSTPPPCAPCCAACAPTASARA
ncbi:MAG: hypothetical protein MUE42_13395 [Opitutaceae bacterium]|nr:hypothetical protein [Opitutaceae bacterium]